MSSKTLRSSRVSVDAADGLARPPFACWDVRGGRRALCFTGSAVDDEACSACPDVSVLFLETKALPYMVDVQKRKGQSTSGK